MAEAEKLATAGKRIDAHEALEMVRVVFWKARSDMGMSYLLDLHTAFHEPMEAFVDLAEKPGAEPAKLKSLLAELSEEWSVVEKGCRQDVLTHTHRDATIFPCPFRSILIPLVSFIM